jgi:hypothetical protein
MACVGLAAAMVMSGGVARAEGPACPKIETPGGRVDLQGWMIEGSETEHVETATWSPPAPARRFWAVARFDITNGKMELPEMLGARFSMAPLASRARGADLYYVVKVGSARPWRAKINIDPDHADTVEVFGGLMAKTRPDLMKQFMASPAVTFAVETANGEVVERETVRLPSPRDWGKMKAQVEAEAITGTACAASAGTMSADHAWVHAPPPMPDVRLPPPVSPH